MATTKIKKARQRSGLTQRQVAADLQIPLGTLRSWEQGVVRNMSYSELKKLADYYGVTVDYLFNDDALPIGGDPNIDCSEKLRPFIKSLNTPGKELLVELAENFVNTSKENRKLLVALSKAMRNI